MKEFNVTGTCIPHLHYMVNIDHKVDQVLDLIEKGKYFVISRPRQYGKTSMIYTLEQRLKDNYVIISTSFEGLGDSKFEDTEKFCGTIFETLADGLYQTTEEEKEKLRTLGIGLKTLEDVSNAVTQYTRQLNKKIILIIDEVDRASNYNLFIHFLGMLRDKYLKRNSGKDTTFHSVILAGLHDIKNIKLKMQSNRGDGFQSAPSYNSPWNIATEFKVDMSFSAEEIETMLVDYNSHHITVGTGHDPSSKHALHLRLEQEDIPALSKEIYKYTSGYPFLVSKICKVIEEELDRDWTLDGIQNAVTKILEEQNTLFDDMIKNIENHLELYELLKSILVFQKIAAYNMDNPTIQRGVLYGLLKKDVTGKIAIHNKIFEIRLYNYFVSKIELSNHSLDDYNFQDAYLDQLGNINMEKVLLKFQEFIKGNYSNKDIEFYERHGRLLLIAFIKPIINTSALFSAGCTGFYYLEAQHSYERRSDMIITFNKKEYILELKLWYGQKYHEEGLKQLAGYLDSRNHTTGYLVAFNFNQNKEFTNKWNEVEGKKIFEVLV
jgi:hypothetical protein